MRLSILSKIMEIKEGVAEADNADNALRVQPKLQIIEPLTAKTWGQG